MAAFGAHEQLLQKKFSYKEAFISYILFIPMECIMHIYLNAYYLHTMFLFWNYEYEK